MALSELVNNIKFKADWKTLKRVKREMLNIEKKAQQMRRKVEKPMKPRVNMGNVRKLKSELKGLKAHVDVSSVKRAKAQLKGLREQAKATKSSLKSMASGAVTAGAFAAGAGIGYFGKKLFDTNVSIARYRSSLKTAVGSQEEATKQFQNLRNFAGSTPFALEQSVGAFIKLKNLGLDPSNRALQSYGNTATAMGKSMTDMIEAVADASTGEFERLKEFGIKSSKQGDQVEFTFKGVKTKVKNDSKAIQEYLLKIGETDFAGAMADQMNSLPGIVSNIQDNITGLLMDIGDGGFNEAITPLLAGLRDGIAGINGKEIGKKLGDGIKTAVRFFKILSMRIKLIIDQLGGIEQVSKVAGAALALLIAPIIGGKIQNGYKALQAIYSVVRSMTMMSGAKGLFALLGGWPALIGVAAVAVGYLAYEVYKFANGGGGLIADLIARFPILGQMVDRLKEVWAELQPELRIVWELVKMFVQTAIDGFNQVATSILSAFGVGLEGGGSLLMLLFEIGMVVLQVAVHFVQFALSAGIAILGFVMSAQAAIWGWVAGVIAKVMWMGGVIVGTFLMLAGAIGSFVMQGIALLISLWNNPQQAMEGMKTKAMGVIDAVKAAFKAMVDTVVGFFTDGFGRIGGIIGGLLGKVSDLSRRTKQATTAAQGAAPKVSYVLPGGGGGINFNASIYNQNTVNASGADPMRLGAIQSRQTREGTGGGLSDAMRAFPRMIPGGLYG